MFILFYILKKVKEKYGHSLKLATYLQLPVLHITKYHLLLHRFLKLVNQEEEPALYALMCEALDLMKKVNDEINNHIIDVKSLNEKLSNINIEQLTAIYGRLLKQV